MATIAVQVGEAPELEAFLAQRIYEYNASATGYGNAESFTALSDEGGTVEAGVCGYTWGGCCYVSYLWVVESSRHKGLGSDLLAAVEHRRPSHRLFQRRLRQAAVGCQSMIST
ncbi:MAG TPA: GNAT family N-acetyltransferase [Burkholderiales bacterium]|nr:GNAT family N-acetyltransferase [Burkholderiales bacterium]